MDQNSVKRLESELEEAIAEVLSRLGAGKLPLNPSPQIIHFMSKAAVAVYEAAVDLSHASESRRR